MNVSTNQTISMWRGPSKDPRIIGWFAATVVTNGFGVIANIILLLSLTVYKPLRRSASSALIIHCIAIDLCATVVAVPIDTIPVFLGPTWPLPLTFCKYQGLYLYITYVASQYASTVLAFHRLTAAIVPHKFHIFTTKLALAWMILLPWLLSTAINIFPTAEGPTASVALRRRFEITRTLFLLFLWLCVSIYPINLVASFSSKRYATDLSLQLFLRWLSTSFGCMNPIFFWASSKLFQAGIATVIKCQWLRRLRRQKVLPCLATISRTGDLGLRTLSNINSAARAIIYSS
ncbi:hypothetical protein BV898_03270 [Hypsibius exemplaris]|uniref:G-protein coupled receptors family 1 profile domain-containing protein n=1 Tax=Hypsibius exemplaris TaxID=2072580 RepID=A0A1W0X5H4_HYPEX|nr:hypothetical protein BV898_03270 [Hypsibius exemplaris]